MTTDEKVDLILKELSEIRAHLTAKKAPAAKKAAAEGEIADAADLDSKYGDEPIKKDPSPKYWGGESFVGCKMSECPPEYLDALATYRDACAYMNEKEGNPDKAKYAEYDRRCARRARGWAARKRSGWEPAAREPGADDFGDVPFV